LDGEKDEEERDGAGDGVEVLLVTAGAVGLVTRGWIGLQQNGDGVISVERSRAGSGSDHEANR